MLKKISIFFVYIEKGKRTEIFLILDKIRQTINIKSIIIIIEVILMKNEFIKSLQMIKILKIENQEQYENLQKDFLILSLDSLKYISQKNSFKDIVKMANEI